MTITDTQIFGCFVSCQAAVYDAAKTENQRLVEQEQFNAECQIFRSYIWGENGICNTLKKLRNTDYGQDLKLALFQFYLKPIPYLLQNLKAIESYRKDEKSIGIPIIINDENFFGKSEDERYAFLKRCVLQKIDLLDEVVRKKKLDTKIHQLKIDLQQIFNPK